MKKIFLLALVGSGIYFITKKKATTTTTANPSLPAKSTTTPVPSAATQTIVPTPDKAPTVAGTETIGTINTANGTLPLVLGMQLKIGSVVEYSAKISTGIVHYPIVVVATVQGIKDTNTIMVQPTGATEFGIPVSPTDLMTGLKEVKLTVITKVYQ